ncbi:MAG: hypothetical protein EXR66_03875 [Dehalococcoidia bacterium]|nr:hypothetical protein [Dehalococcoidia bacterium]
MLYVGAPQIVAASYAIIGWHMVLMGTALGLLSAHFATQGELAALVPLPLMMVAFGIGTYSLRQAAWALRSVMR